MQENMHRLFQNCTLLCLFACLLIHLLVWEGGGHLTMLSKLVWLLGSRDPPALAFLVLGLRVEALQM